MAKEKAPKGYIERCTFAQISGWAIDGDQPAELEIRVNGAHLAGIRCDGARPDISTVDAGFSFVFPQILAPSDSVSVRFLDGRELANSPLHPSQYAGYLDRCTTERVEGWASFQTSAGEVDIFVDDVRLARVSCHVSRPDLVSLGVPANSGFAFRFPEPIECSARVLVRFPDGSEITGSPRTPILEEPAKRGTPSTMALPGKEAYDVDSACAILASEFVDDTLFFKGLGGSKKDRAAVELYLALPWEARPDLSWFFDRRFYAQSCPDVIEGHLDPLIHFIAFGAAELRDPHPLINLRHIQSSNPDLFPGPPAIDTLLKFLTHDLGDPSPFFSVAYYRTQLGNESAASGGMLLHFLQHGILLGLKPAPGFTPIEQYAALDDKSFDVRDSLRRLTIEALGFASLLEHYRHQGGQPNRMVAITSAPPSRYSGFDAFKSITDTSGHQLWLCTIEDQASLAASLDEIGEIEPALSRRFLDACNLHPYSGSLRKDEQWIVDNVRKCARCNCLVVSDLDLTESAVLRLLSPAASLVSPVRPWLTLISASAQRIVYRHTDEGRNQMFDFLLPADAGGRRTALVKTLLASLPNKLVLRTDPLGISLLRTSGPQLLAAIREISLFVDCGELNSDDTAFLTEYIAANYAEFSSLFLSDKTPSGLIDVATAASWPNAPRLVRLQEGNIH
jgi:hypothetical protein